MKRIVLLILILINICKFGLCKSKADSVLTYIEPVSRVEFVIPNAHIVESDSVLYRKAIIHTPETSVYIYSMPNQYNQPFKWSEVNRFDANNKYGIMYKQVKLTNTDGYIRYYEYVDKKQDKKHFYAVCLIRGDCYALYFSERSDSPNGFIMPDIIKNYTFSPTTHHRVNNDGSTTISYWIVIIGCCIIAFFVKYIFESERRTLVVISGVISLFAAFAILYWALNYNLANVFLGLLIPMITWFFVVLSDNWDEFVDMVLKCLDSFSKS